MTPRGGEQGYAMVAAIGAMAMLATIALTLIEGNRADIAMARAERDQAAATAAADAGLAMALDGVLSRNPTARWPIDGRPLAATFGKARLAIRIEDERGKVPINLLDEETAARLVQAAGLSGEQARIAAASLLDWLDEDDIARPDGAEAGFYRQRGARPRNGPLRSIGELAEVRGFDPQTLARIRPFVTVHYGAGQFETRHARPEAIVTMLGQGAAATTAIQRAREAAGQRTAIDLDQPPSLTDRTLTILVTATIPSGGKATRQTIVEITGAPRNPYIVKSAR